MFVCLFVCRIVKKNYWPHFHETWWKVVALAAEEPIKFWSWSKSQGGYTNKTVKTFHFHSPCGILLVFFCRYSLSSVRLIIWSMTKIVKITIFHCQNVLKLKPTYLRSLFCVKPPKFSLLSYMINKSSKFLQFRSLSQFIFWHFHFHFVGAHQGKLIKPVFW